MSERDRSASDRSERPTLYTRGFLSLLVVALLGFATQGVIQPVVPLYVLDLGGDATLVGLVVAAFSLPSLVLRPLVGRLADRWGTTMLLVASGGGLGIASFAYLVPHLGVLVVIRVLHGVAWGAFSTAAHAAAAALAPAHRRGEAAALFGLMPALAHSTMPAAGVALYSLTGHLGPFALTGVLAFGAMALVKLIHGALRIREERPPSSVSEGLLERGALFPMTLQFLFTMVTSLFIVFPPLFASIHGLPVGDLTAYYLTYGVVMVATRLVLGRMLDRHSRNMVIGLGGGIGAVALLLASRADTILALTVAGSLFSAAAAITSPATMAVAIDRAKPQRLGAAMGTYTLGFQAAIGLGAALWGVVIDTLGFSATCQVAITSQLALIALLLADRRHRQRER